MPVYVMSCPECGRATRTLVLDGCRTPAEWFCSQCKSQHPWPQSSLTESHPWETQTAACLCCCPGSGHALSCSAVE